MPVSHQHWGTAHNQPVDLFTLTNSSGITAKISNYGGAITELHTPDRAGNFANIVLGFDSLDRYLGHHPSFGVLIGRYANRIAKGRFTLDGKTYQLGINNGPNNLHGGPIGFDKKVWHASTLNDGIRLELTSPDGDMGFPGTLTASVIYRLTNDNHLLIEYTATCDAPTPVNLTNHSYFNLRGAGSGDVLSHVLHINADAYTPVDEFSIPTGEVRPVTHSPFDFRQPLAIGHRINELKRGSKNGGYDHNFVLNGELADTKRAAIVSDPHSGRAMELHTTQPGVQLYTANYLDGSISGLGGSYPQHAAFCLETQHFPDSPNQPDFPSTILLPGDTYIQRSTFKFLTV